MTDELKTLKDLHSEFPYDREEDLIDKLREEAVKWVKKIRKDNPIENMGGGFTELWIKHFFNLPEEDLE